MRWCELTREVDCVVVGSGFGGSLMAMVARRLGLSVMLLEQGRHPRMTIGESTTPLSNLLMERLSAQYDLPRLAPLAKWGSWQREYPEVACGLKRGFTFYQDNAKSEPLVVAASPHDAVADTHWYRADVDHFLVKEAQRAGVEYLQRVTIHNLVLGSQFPVMDFTDEGKQPISVRAGFLVDATGPRGFLHQRLHLGESALPGMTPTECLYSHFRDVGRSTGYAEAPFAVDDAAVHHVFDGGWVWVLRFNNGLTSAGVAATAPVARELRLHEGEVAWQRLLQRLPKLQTQFSTALACEPFRHMPAVSFRSSTIVGNRWAMLPSAAGFVDPLLSSGFSLTLLGIERLARILGKDDVHALQAYARQTDDDLVAASRLIGALYATMDNFEAFHAVLLLYFAAVSFAETAMRLDKPELAQGFLLHRNPAFGPAVALLLKRAHTLERGAATHAFAEAVRSLIEPFDVGRFAEPPMRNCYPVRAEDLLQAGHKLGAERKQILSMLEKSGLIQTSSN